LIGFFFFESSLAVPYLLPLIAGTLVYIGATDLIPELHKETKMSRSFLLLFSLIVGLALLYFLKIYL